MPTEAEILELGRKALKKHKITVYVVQHTSKHGETINVYGGPQAANDAADEIMAPRVEGWDEGEKATFDRLIDFDLRLSFYNEVEATVSYGDVLKVIECVVQ